MDLDREKISTYGLKIENFECFDEVANEGFKLRSIDIRAAFLQARELDRDVYLLPPKDIRKEGYIWRLKKPLYGLNDVLWKFWFRVR